jgi:PAS domain S-box-containing protein
MRARTHILFQKTIVRYLLAIVIVAGALALRIRLTLLTGTNAPFGLFFAAVLVVSLCAGVGPAVCALLISLPIVAFTLMMPAGYAPSQVVFQSLLFAINGCVVIYLAFLMKREQQAAQNANRQLRDANEEITSAMARTRDVIELAPVAFFQANLATRFTDINHAACQLMGYGRDELVGMRIIDIIPAEDVPRLAAAREYLASPGTFEVSEWTLLRKYGTPVCVEVSAKILPDGRWQAFAHDISERKRFERTLQESEKQQRFLAEASVVLSASLDYETTLVSVVRLAVQNIADWCAVDVVDKQGKLQRLKVASADPAKAALCAVLEQMPPNRDLPNFVRSVSEGGRPILVEHVTSEWVESFAQTREHLRALLATGVMSLIAVPLTMRGQPLGVLVFGSSTPSRVYGQGDLRVVEALADRAAAAIENARLYRASLHATRLRDEVLGVVAHDLRNPLSAILLQAAALTRHGLEPEPQSHKQMEAIHRAATRMNRLIQDLLDVALMESGQLTIEPARLSARELIVYAVEMQRPLASSSGVELGVDVDDVPDVWGDRHRLLQVFENLIGNAIKFTKAGGLVTTGAASGDHAVVFWVTDTGSGMPSDELPRVFDRFWQRTSARHQGAGLGLAIAKAIVEAHGGRIWVDSIEGHGTTFSFTIPTGSPNRA